MRTEDPRFRDLILLLIPFLVIGALVVPSASAYTPHPLSGESHEGSTAPTPRVPPQASSHEVLSGIVDTVLVVAPRPGRGIDVEHLCVFAAVHDVDRATERLATVADVLERGAGVHVRRYGGLGAYSTASIRGSSADQVEIYMDGIPLQSAQWGATNLADLPLDNLERVEVYRGGAPVDFGTAGIGGVVNLVSRRADRARSLGCVSQGSFGTWKVDLMRSDRLGRLDYLMSFHHMRSRGDFAYLDRHGTPQNAEDDEIVKRQNNAFRQSDLLLQVRPASWRGWELELSDNLFVKDSGLPGTESVHIESAHLDALRHLARVAIKAPPALTNALHLRAAAFHQYRRDRFYNPDHEVGLNRSDTDNTSRSYGGNVLATFFWFQGSQVVKLFGEARCERFVPQDKNPRIGVGFTRKRRTTTVNLSDRLSLLDDRLALTVDYRYQEAVDNYTGPEPFGAPPAPRDDPHWSTFHGPQFGVRWQPAPFLTLKANRTRYARLPSMLEVFGMSGGTVGNPELLPEQGTMRDAGIAVRVPSSSSTEVWFEASVFRADREDLIVFLQNSQRTVKAFNLESAHSEGVELTARVDIGPSCFIGGAYTYQEARNTGESPTYRGNLLPYAPRHELFVQVRYEAARVSLWHEFHMAGEAYRDRANLPENLSPTKYIHDVGVRVPLSAGRLALTAEVQNLLGVQISDVEGYPLPGRAFFLTLEFDTSGTQRAPA